MAQNITLKTLTPLHIGSGNEYAGNFEFVYFQKEQKIVIIDERKILDIIGIENIDEWVKIIDKKQDLYKFLLQYKSNLTIKDIDKKIINAQNIPNTNQSIKQFMQDGMGKNYIAGSSIKGAVRTALLTFLIKKDANFATQQKNLGFENRNSFKFKDGEIIKKYLGTDPNHDILRLLQIGDFYPLKDNLETECLKSGIMNLFNQGWSYKREQYGFAECMPKKTEAQGKIHLNEDLKKGIEQKEKNSFLTQYFEYLTLPNLFKIINEHTKTLVESELVFWEDEDINDDIEEYLDILEDIKNAINNIENKEKTCILRLGAGSGWDFMTGSWAKGKDDKDEYIINDDLWNIMKRSLRYKSYSNDVIFPKTRKLSKNQPLGFVELSY